MGKTAIISIDGHVKASRRAYRDYLPKKYVEAYDQQVKAAEDRGLRDAGNIHPEFAPEVQWDSDLRIRNLESIGVIAEVLFPNGQPFQLNLLEDTASFSNVELARVGRQAYNRWLADFCAEAPERRRGQLSVSFEDVGVAETIDEIYWAKEVGLGGVRLPALVRGSKYYFDRSLDPIWSACVETGLPVSQHGGAGDPNQPSGSGRGLFRGPGFGTFLMIATENAFFSNRSLWMMIAGGVFDRFPALRAAWIETQVHFMVPTITYLDNVVRSGWMEQLGIDSTIERLPSEYFGTNVWVGLSPFTPKADPGADFLALDAGDGALHLGPGATMWGTDYPHFESNFLQSFGELATLATTSGLCDEDIGKVLFHNAADLFGFDSSALQPHVDRVGFDLDHVRAHADEHIANMPDPINLILQGGMGSRRRSRSADSGSRVSTPREP